MQLASIMNWFTFPESSQVVTRRKQRSILSLETLESREVPAINPTPMEQELLELTNKMRMDPAGELNRLLVSTNPLQARDAQVQSALSYFGVSGSTLVSQWASLTPAAPLAWAEGLMNSARTHNQAMIAADTQSHQLPGEADLGTRATNGGYSNWNALGENIYAYSNTVLYGHAGFAIDWGFGPGGIQSPAGHRVNIMNPSFREVGMSVIAENNSATSVGPLVITQDFGNRFSFGNAYLLGVVFADGNSNNSYNAGEGLGGVTVTIAGAAGTFTTTTMSAGGYQRQVPSGSYTVTFSGGSLSAPITKTITVGTANVKLDAINGQGGTGGGGSGGGTGGTGGSVTNSAPVLDANYVATLTSIYQNNTTSVGNTVASIVGNSITDVNTTNQLGIAVTTASSTTGEWQYSINNGSTWSSLSAASSSASRLLRMTDRIRFVPNANFVGSASFNYRAWDQTSGAAGGTASTTSVGGTTAFSSAIDSASISVIQNTTGNNAPVLNTSGTYQLPYVAANSTTPPAVLVSTLVGVNITDVDANALEGIAITALDSTKGTWRYSLNGGANWYTLSTVSNTSAMLLRSSDMLRFYPNSGMTGVSSIVFRAWDRTTGIAGTLANVSTVGGSSAYSADMVFARVQVGNTAPVLNTTNPFNLNTYTNGTTNTGTLVGSLLGNAVTDSDMNAKRGIAVIGLAGTTTGTWQYSTNGGATWTSFGSTSASRARLLRAEDMIRYVPNSSTFKGTVSLNFRAWDQFSGTAGALVNISTLATVGGRTAYSSQVGNAILRVV